MDVFSAVITKCIEILNLHITFSPFTFTFAQVLLCLACLSIAVTFISHLFDR